MIAVVVVGGGGTIVEMADVTIRLMRRMRHFVFWKNGPILASFYVYFRLFQLIQFKSKFIEANMCLGLKPGPAGWKVQTNPLSYGGTP